MVLAVDQSCAKNGDDMPVASMMQKKSQEVTTQTKTFQGTTNSSLCGTCGTGINRQCLIFDLWCLWWKVAPCFNRGDSTCTSGQCLCDTGTTCQKTGSFMVVITWKQCVNSNTAITR